MENLEKVNCSFPSLAHFKRQPWSSLITFLKEPNSKLREDYSVTVCTKKDVDMEPGKKSDMELIDLSQFKGQPWSAWIKHLDTSVLSNTAEKVVTDCRVTRLPRQDMGIYGICPENDMFCAVVCSTCGAIVKPQGLKRHLEIKHTSDSETVLLPPPQVPAKKIKTANVKMKNKESLVTLLPVHSNENIVPCIQPAVTSGKQMDTSINTNTTTASKSYISKANSLLQPFDTDSEYSHAPRRKSPNITNDRKTQKSRDKDHESEKQVVLNDDSKQQQASRPLSSKTNLVLPRRIVTGRTKDFNKLVAEHRATKDSMTHFSLSNNKSRAQSVLKTVITASETFDTEFASKSSSQSSQSTIPEPVPVKIQSPQQTSPSSPILNTILTATATTACSIEYPGSLTNANINSSNTMTNNSMETDATIPFSYTATPTSPPSAQGLQRSAILNVNSSLTSDSCDMSTSSAVTCTPQVLHVMPVTPSHLYTYKLPGSPVIIVNSKESPVSISSGNTESVGVVTPGVSISKSPQPIIVSRDVIESLNVPVVMEMPTHSESLGNITVYTSYPKPLVVSTFSSKKVGQAVVFTNRRLDFIRSQFKSVLKKGRRMNTNLGVPLKNSMQGEGEVSVSAATATLFGVKTTSSTRTATGTCRFTKTTPTVVSNIQQATSLLAHRPNILRTTAPRQHMQKILATGLKRPATSSQQLAGLDCKHMLFKPATNNINVSGIIGKMIVRQHEVADVSETSAASHLALDKAVPMNIK